MGLSPLRSCYTNNSIDTAPNPDPSRYTILKIEFFNNATLLHVHYKDCTNFEGEKLMLYRGHFTPLPGTPIDPHFQENGKGPVARFEPTELGWNLARESMRSL